MDAEVLFALHLFSPARVCPRLSYAALCDCDGVLGIHPPPEVTFAKKGGVFLSLRCAIPHPLLQAPVSPLPVDISVDISYVCVSVSVFIFACLSRINVSPDIIHSG